MIHRKIWSWWRRWVYTYVVRLNGFVERQFVEPLGQLRRRCCISFATSPLRVDTSCVKFWSLHHFHAWAWSGFVGKRHGVEMGAGPEQAEPCGRMEEPKSSPQSPVGVSGWTFEETWTD
jgi:hypothetical protein